jgi:hypothetical protein
MIKTKTKLRVLIFVLIATVLIGFTWIMRKKSEKHYTLSKTSLKPAFQGPPMAKNPLSMNDRPLPPKVISPSRKPANVVSSEWPEQLEKGLRTQGGDALKELKIEKVQSLIWNHQGINLHVESVRITLTNDRNEKTSFRALVDSQNGKILQTWDQPVIDPINPRNNFAIRIDPRYLQD